MGRQPRPAPTAIDSSHMPRPSRPVAAQTPSTHHSTWMTRTSIQTSCPHPAARGAHSPAPTLEPAMRRVRGPLGWSSVGTYLARPALI